MNDDLTNPEALGQHAGLVGLMIAAFLALRAGLRALGLKLVPNRPPLEPKEGRGMMLEIQGLKEMLARALEKLDDLRDGREEDRIAATRLRSEFDSLKKEVDRIEERIEEVAKRLHDHANLVTRLSLQRAPTGEHVAAGGTDSGE